MFTFKKEKEIDRQLERYVEHKAKRSLYMAQKNRERILEFVKITDCDNVFDAKDHLISYKEYLARKYPSDHEYLEALKCLQGFLKYYRCISWYDML